MRSFGMVFFALVMSQIVPPHLLAQAPPSLVEAVRRFAEARGDVTSYELSVTGMVEDPGAPQALTDGSVYLPTKRTVAFELKIAGDRESGRSLIARREQVDDAETGVVSFGDWNIIAVTPEYLVTTRNGRGTVTPPGRKMRKPEHFDPLAIGLTFATEYRRGDPLEKIVQNLRAWPQMKPTILASGRVRYGQEEKRGTVIEIDPDKGHSPVRLRHPDGTGGEFEINVVPALVNDAWLPSVATVLTRSEKHILRFDWHSVNAPLDHRFSLDHLDARYGLDLVDRRKNTIE